MLQEVFSIKLENNKFVNDCMDVYPELILTAVERSLKDMKELLTKRAKTLLNMEYNIDKLRTIDVNDITDKYETMMLHHHPFIEILKKGDENEFVEWLHSGEDLGEQKENIYRDILLPEIIKYERYSWVKHLNL